jgi:hypothetical protein
MNNIEKIDNELNILVKSLDNILGNMFKHYITSKTSKYDIIYEQTIFKIKDLTYKKKRLQKLNNILNE